MIYALTDPYYRAHLIRTPGRASLPLDKQMTNLNLQSLISKVEFNIGSPGDQAYQSIVYQPCRVCQEMVNTLDVATGYSTVISSDICYKCALDRGIIPGLIFTPPLNRN